MRVWVSIPAVCCLLTVPASAEEPTAIVSALDNPAYSQPARPWTSIKDAQQQTVLDRFEGVRIASADQQSCQDRISKARELLGKSLLLEREPASPEKPHLIYAVDRRQDGCSVMVMKGDPDDIRPLPLPAKGPFLMIPAEGAEE